MRCDSTEVNCTKKRYVETKTLHAIHQELQRERVPRFSLKAACLYVTAKFSLSEESICFLYLQSISNTVKYSHSFLSCTLQLYVLISISDHVMFSREFSFCFFDKLFNSYISTCIRRHLQKMFYKNGKTKRTSQEVNSVLLDIVLFNGISWIS